MAPQSIKNVRTYPDLAPALATVLRIHRVQLFVNWTRSLSVIIGGARCVRRILAPRRATLQLLRTSSCAVPAAAWTELTRADWLLRHDRYINAEQALEAVLSAIDEAERSFH